MRSKQSYSFTLTLMVHFFVSGNAFAQGIKPGDKVTLITDGKFWVSGKELAVAAFGDNYRVDKISGDWLWVSNKKGYLKRADVVPYDEAIAYFTKEIEKSPDMCTYCNRALAWKKRGELDIAIGDYTEAIRLSDENSSPYLFRALVYEQKNDFDSALKDYDSLVRLSRDFPDGAHRTYFYRGWFFGARKEFEKAITDFNKAIKIKPDYSEAYSARLRAWNALNDFDKALADCNEVIRLEPLNPDSYIWRGEMNLQIGNYEKAIADLTEAIRLDARSSTGYATRAFAWEEQGDYGKALSDYKEAAKIDGSMLNGVAFILATCPDDAIRNGTQAVEFAKRAVDAAPDNWKVIDTLASAYAETGDFESAVKCQKNAIELAPLDEKKDFGERLTLYESRKPYRYDHRKAAKLRILNYKIKSAKQVNDDAARAELYAELLTLDPNNLGALKSLAEIRSRNGANDEADRLLSTVIEKDPEDALVYLARGKVRVRLQKPEAAIADISKALELSPQNVDSYMERARQYRKIGDFDRAILDFTVALYAAKDDPVRAKLSSERGDVWRSLGDDAAAAADYAESARLGTGDSEKWRLAAWILATSPRDDARDGDLALQYAEKSCECSDKVDCQQIDTLAAAYAEAGRFPFAVSTQEKAIARLDADAAPEIRAAYEARLELYRSFKPFRDPPSTAATSTHGR